MKKPEMSDMMKHYLSVKDKYTDCVVFYRLGDFYEMFFDDAVEVSKLLELTLTGKDCGLKERAPMCGIPYHAADGYIARLVALGKKVAICEQLTEPGAQKGLVERGVVRIVSNGTVTENNLFDEKSNNFITTFVYNNSKFGVAWADITTGDFYCEEANSDNEFIDALYRINPAEIVCDSKSLEKFNSLPEPVRTSFGRISKYSDKCFYFSSASRVICEHFSVQNFSIFIPEDKELAVSASGALISYFNETQMRKVDIISKITYFCGDDYLILDSIAQRNLEVVRSMRDGKSYGTLLWTVDYTSTAGGGRKIKEMLLNPLRDIEKINYRLDGVEDLYKEGLVREGLTETLRQTKDLERLCGRISNKIVSPRDCVAIKDTLMLIPSIKLQLAGMNSKILKDIANGIGTYDDLATLLDRIFVDEAPVTTKEGKFVKRGFDETLDKYLSLRENATQILKDFEVSEKEKTGIKTLKVSYNKVFGYYIEVSNSFKDKVPYNYIRKQTLVNGERFITEELKKLEEEILTCNEKILKIENEIFSKITSVLAENIPSMLKTARCISMLDVLLSFATVSKKQAYVRPEILSYGKQMNIVAGRHPVVEKNSKGSFIPNDVLLDNDENRMMIITGPNMAGKSTYMRQIALLTILAHAGCFVPAKEAQIPLTDKIFTRVGASDNLLFNQSTFMVEMTEVANIILNATENSLLILDEVGRGTSTYDGLSIAWAVVEYIVKNIKAKTLFATHYHELSELENSLKGVKNYKILAKEINGQIVFIRKIARGSANKSFGIEVASLAGVPKAVTSNAKSILKALEKNDIAVSSVTNNAEPQAKLKSFVEKYISELDLNNLTPLKAFEILTFLKGKIND